ncbi:MAG: hypothetical protein WC755_07775 [Candidatus Woesearchaeota archaeon]|jgi:hypothetical protein
MYKEIVELRPYFHSLREFNTDVSLDIKIPILWDIISEQKDFPNIRFREQDRNEKTMLISYITINDADGYNDVFKCVRQVIKSNLEKEKKVKLLEEKIDELKKSFDNKMNELKKVFEEKDLSSLEKLKVADLYEHKTGKGIELSNSERLGEDTNGTSGAEKEDN